LKTGKVKGGASRSGLIRNLKVARLEYPQREKEDRKEIALDLEKKNEPRLSILKEGKKSHLSKKKGVHFLLKKQSSTRGHTE